MCAGYIPSHCEVAPVRGVFRGDIPDADGASELHRVRARTLQWFGRKQCDVRKVRPWKGPQYGATRGGSGVREVRHGALHGGQRRVSNMCGMRCWAVRRHRGMAGSKVPSVRSWEISGNGGQGIVRALSLGEVRQSPGHGRTV